MIGTFLTTTVLSFYCLLPTVSPFFVALLTASLSFSLKLFLHVSGPNFLRSLAILLSALSLGSLLSFLFTHRSIFTLSLPATEIFAALILYLISSTLLPFSAILLAEIIFFRFPPHSYPILVPALVFALAGIAQERPSGVGRTVWWNTKYPSSGGLGRWVDELGGNTLWDFIVASAGFSVAWCAWSWFEREEWWMNFLLARQETGETGDLLQHYEQENNGEGETTEVEGPVGATEEGGGEGVESIPTEQTPLLPARTDEARMNWETKKNRLLKPLSILAFLLFLWLISPLFSTTSLRTSTARRSHPSPIDPEFVYPPMQVGCVSIPSSTTRRGTGGVRLEALLRETRTVASRGAKVISLEETAVSLIEEEGEGKRDGKGWEGMGQAEKGLLRSVGEIADMYKVRLLSVSVRVVRPKRTYNIATLVGPSISSPLNYASSPRIVFSTTKHHPISFIESYSHSHRLDPVLGSSPNQLPLSTIEIPNHSGVPRSVPDEEVAISAAICQDIAFPSLLSSYIRPTVSLSRNKDNDDQKHSKKQKKRSPQLILNPSRVPLTSLALAQVNQVKSRAIEQDGWILRCDSSSSSSSEHGEGGISTLIAPDGSVRVLQPTGAAVGSNIWSSPLDIELSSGRGSPFSRVWGKDRFGSEFAVWLWTLLAVIVAELIASWRREWVERVKEAWRWVRRSEERLIENEAEQGRVSEELI
ncbi:uncharacterized protein JCM6883_006630 [Sporobolomyces salmoneus]|uniref:uncharacterized protein n=1 Tax=Sporobolomyces salmoneus TaxID=183962 RepID=UPI00316DEE85